MAHDVLKASLGINHKKIGKLTEIAGKRFIDLTQCEFINWMYRLFLRLMAQKKLQRFREIKSFTNVLEYPENIAGKWNEHFENNFPVVLELACGKGEYAVGLAKLFPGRNYIGVDIKGNRLWAGAKFAFENNLNNVAFLRTQIHKISSYFNVNEVSEIWITFPDPQLRYSKAKKRLTHPAFLKLYKTILQHDGKIHLKTDSPDLYNFTKAVIELHQLVLISDIDDVYKNGEPSAELNIKTYYESLDIANSKKIFYLCFTLPAKIIDADEALDNFLKKTNEK
jgi:tRNA (guanine-N7-)-methyltransferase